MTFERLIVLSPHYGIEQFDLQRKEDEAESLLAAWSALWHPLLVSDAQTLPNWLPAADPPREPAQFLIVVPGCSEPFLPEGWLLQAEAAGACVLRGLRRRDEIVAAALQPLGHSTAPVHAALAADFLALGFCHLQVELLTRKLRYMSNLDEAALRSAVLQAAADAIRGDADSARGHLQAAFDRLHEAREYFYPVEPRLLDLTLVASTTLGAALREELAGARISRHTGITDNREFGGADILVCQERHVLPGRQECLPHCGEKCQPGLPRNVLLGGEVLEEMARPHEPATLAALKRAVEANAVGVIGGELVEMPLPMLDPEAVRLSLERGIEVYRRHLGRQPGAFGRRRFGLTPLLPGVLAGLGFRGAFHCTLDDGRFPKSDQSRLQWEGIDGTTIEALGVLPIDAGSAEPFLRLPETLSNAMNLDQSGALVMAHWPGHASPWYNDLRRIAAYAPILGRFVTIDDYLQQTTLSGPRRHYQADEYRSPYLKQDVAGERRDPISRWVRYYARRSKLESIESLLLLTAACGTSAACGFAPEALAANVEDSLDADPATAAALDQQLDRQLTDAMLRFSQAVSSGATTQRGCLMVNPCSFPRRSCAEMSDVPAMGFAWIGATAGVETPCSPQPAERKGWFGRRKPRVDPPLAEENILRNEFFEARFDPWTGAIRTISDYTSRDPRLAQQIALRLPQVDSREPGEDANYSIMAADELKVTSAGPVLGEMVCRGRLMDRGGRRLAGFTQTTRAWRGSPIIELQIELDVDRLPGPNPWDSYYAVRFAWKDETAAVHRSVHLASLPTELTQIESPHFLDICRGKQRTTLLCGGLPYHRRFGLRKLDTILIVHGETAWSFRVGIGIDVPHPTAAALGFIAPPMLLSDQPLPPTPSGWLFHLDCRNVLATHWAPLFCTPHAPREETLDSTPHPPANLLGFRVRLLETDGHGVRLGLRCFRSIASARKINPGDVPPLELGVSGDRVEAHVGPHQWIEVEVQFQP